MRYLVTGGAGFIGSHLVEKLATDGHDVTILDNFSNGHLENLAALHKSDSYYTNVECCDKIDFMSRGKSITYNGIFHLATAPRSSSLTDPKRDIETNCKGMIAVLELARKHDAKVVFTSNSGIYPPVLDGSINESAPNNPTTPYDANKLASEYYCKIWYNLYGIKSTVVRLATVYGERQKVNEELNWRPLVATFIKNIMNNEEVMVNGDGEQTRDLIYVKDVIQGLIKAMESDVNDAEIFLLSTNIETSVNKVLETVESVTGLKANRIHTAPLRGDIRRMRYDYSKAFHRLEFKPEYSLQDGIVRMVSLLVC